MEDKAIKIKDVFSTEKLNSTQKLIMLYIHLRALDDASARITNTEFIEVFKFDWSTLNRNLNALEDKGYITRHFSGEETHLTRTLIIN